MNEKNSLGLNLCFKDHEHYSPAIIKKIEKVLKKTNQTAFFTTEKDWVKIKPLKPSFPFIIAKIKIDFKDLLTPTRDEDKGKDLWSVFNVVQEKIIDGDFAYKVAGKLRKARQIKNFKQDQKINKELFDVALEFAK